MTWEIHPFMKESCNAYFVSDNCGHHEVMFYRETAAARIPILARFPQLWIDGKLPQATVELGGIQVHLPSAPLFKGILKNVGEIERGQF